MNYALTVLKAEKARLEHELFESIKFNNSLFAHKKIVEYGPENVIAFNYQVIERQIAELKKAIKCLEETE
ncbi:hypothetical protein PB1_16394 [Bacillus methanolicus PB1]|uniref:Uncharacterized protein n=1 Tax=Bacillus methanolicus PB1 TaxID=997296 RepID=I3DY33_BACMT|nr:hypothetical protein [Bacillus methanolicus]EIJ79154.1 hypothetical protein PB1_16394 [Bacillus methanolicus PB1]